MKVEKRFFYIKNRQNVIGPFTPEQISGMLRKHLLSHNDLISENRIAWKTVKEVFFPDTEVSPEPPREPDLLKKVEATPEPLEKKIEKTAAEKKPLMILPGVISLPDPVCATIALLWNSPRHLQHLYIMLTDTDPILKKRDRTYSLLTLGALLFMVFLLFISLTFVMVPELCGKLSLMLILLFIGSNLLLFLESLLLSAAAKLPQLLELPLVILLIEVYCFGIFTAGLPVCGLFAGGISACPWYWHLPVWLTAASIVIGSIGNLACGMFYLNRRVFNFKRINMVWVVILFVFQFLALFFTGWAACRSICN